MGNETGSLLKWTLRIYGIIAIIYGAVFLFFPGEYISFSGADPVVYGLFRWPGGMLIGFGLGVFLLSRNPAKQGLFVTTAAMVASLIGLALFYTIFAGEYTQRVSGIFVGASINLVAGALLWFSRMQNKDAL